MVLNKKALEKAFSPLKAQERRERTMGPGTAPVSTIRVCVRVRPFRANENQSK